MGNISKCDECNNYNEGKCNKGFVVSFDFGKPYEEVYCNLKELLEGIKKECKILDEEDCPYSDITIYQNDKELSADLISEIIEEARTDIWIGTSPNAWKDRGSYAVFVSAFDSPPSMMFFVTEEEALKEKVRIEKDSETILTEKLKGGFDGLS